jgi:hypothetical protein
MIIILILIIVTREKKFTKAVNHFNAGNKYRYKRPKRASWEYKETLINLGGAIKEEKYDPELTLFILNKLTAGDDMPEVAEVIYTEVNEKEEIKIPKRVKKNVVLKHKIRSDNNNVHDNTFNTELRNQYFALKNTVKSVDAVPIRFYLESTGDPDINKYMKKAFNGMNYKDMGTEEDIANTVWKRINMFSGQKRLDLNEQFLAGIKDSVDKNYVHCAAGRVGRIFSSLAVLDPVFGVIKNDEVVKKEAFDKSGHVYEKIIDKYLDDNKFGEAATSHRKYIKDPKNDEEFDKLIKSELVKYLEEDYSHLNPLLFENIKTSVLTSISI